MCHGEPAQRDALGTSEAFKGLPRFVPHTPSSRRASHRRSRCSALCDRAGPCTPGQLRNAPAPLACIRARFRGDLHVHACAFGVGGVLAAFPRACDVMCAACVRVRACEHVWWMAEAACARRMGFMAGGRGQCVSATRCGRLLHSTPRSLPLNPCTVSQSSLNQCARFSSQCNETRR